MQFARFLMSLQQAPATAQRLKQKQHSIMCTLFLLMLAYSSGRSPHVDSSDEVQGAVMQNGSKRCLFLSHEGSVIYKVEQL